jgi:poly-beta-hydroxyalkanoate depolymerase
MSIDERKRIHIHIKTVDDISELGQIKKADIIKESIQYDKENYYLLDHLDDKEIITSITKLK